MNILRRFTTVAAVLITLLCAVSPSKATVQRGFCTGWPTIPDTLKADGYQGLFSGLAFYVGKDDINRANEMVDLAGPGSTKRLTENELSDFSRLWHDGCVKATIEA